MKNHIESTHPRLVASKKLQTFQVYNGHQVHNMLTIMFDLRFKSLTVVKNYVGHGGLHSYCRNPNLAKCGGEAQHLEKLGV